MAREETIVSGAAGRYAAALFDLASSEGKTAEIEADLDRFAELVGISDDLRRLVRSPVYGADEQVKGLTAVAETVELKGLALNFLLVVARNRRLFAVLDMIRGYKALAATARGEISAEVRTAHPLSPAHAATLREALSAHAGRDVTLVTKVEPALIGGLIVKIGSRMIDTSLRTRLNALKVSMKEARA